MGLEGIEKDLRPNVLVVLEIVVVDLQFFEGYTWSVAALVCSRRKITNFPSNSPEACSAMVIS